MRKIVIAGSVVLSCSSPLAFSDTLYKCTDGQGVVVYGVHAIEGQRCDILSKDPVPRALSKADKDRIAREAKEMEDLQEELRQAQVKDGVVGCRGERMCKKAFQLAQVFISRNASMKIQTATDTILETYNPTEPTRLGMRAIKTPGNGDAERIALEVFCKSDSNRTALICIKKQLGILRQFQPFVEASLR